MVALRAHHHGLGSDPVGSVRGVELPSDEALRIRLANEDPIGYAGFLRMTYPDTYKKWLKQHVLSAPNDFTSTTAVQPVAPHSEPIGYGSVAHFEPRKPVITFPVYTTHYLPAPQIAGLLPAPKPALTHEQDFAAEIAWLALGELIDAFIIDYMQAAGFMTIHDVDLFWWEALNLDGLVVKYRPDNVITIYGSLKQLTDRQDEIGRCGKRASAVYREIPLSPNLKYRYTWRNGTQQEVDR